ncbi:glutamate mutase L [Rhizobacter fulvus]
MPITLAVDFGSTYTKVVAIDCEAETLVGVAQSPTTVSEGVMLRLDRALTRLEAACGVRRADISRRLASSSAAGGLRMVAIGLVPDLTAEAARRAALGAGAKVLRAFAYELSRRDTDELLRIAPDMILLWRDRRRRAQDHRAQRRRTGGSPAAGARRRGRQPHGAGRGRKPFFAKPGGEPNPAGARHVHRRHRDDRSDGALDFSHSAPLTSKGRP